MAIKATDLITLFRQARDEQWGYIWGTRGQIWTQANQNAATREKTVQYGQKWVGKRVADCSGLFVWAYKELGASIYHGSNTIWHKYTTTRKGKVSALQSIRPGTAVFQYRESDGNRSHIGLYVGDGLCIEAKGTQSGVKPSSLDQWDEYGELSDVDYTGMPEEPYTPTRRTLRKGADGADVEYLQKLLIAEGYDVGVKGADGIFGSETLSAVRAYQSDRDLTPDGIVGPLTWAALEADEEREDDENGEDKPEAPDDDSVGATTGRPWDELTQAEKIENLNARLMAVEGGESDG